MIVKHLKVNGLVTISIFFLSRLDFSGTFRYDVKLLTIVLQNVSFVFVFFFFLVP